MKNVKYNAFKELNGDIGNDRKKMFVMYDEIEKSTIRQLKSMEQDNTDHEKFYTMTEFLYDEFLNRITHTLGRSKSDKFIKQNIAAIRRSIIDDSILCHVEDNESHCEVKSITKYVAFVKKSLDYLMSNNIAIFENATFRFIKRYEDKFYEDDDNVLTFDIEQQCDYIWRSIFNYREDKNSKGWNKSNYEFLFYVFLIKNYHFFIDPKDDAGLEILALKSKCILPKKSEKGSWIDLHMIVFTFINEQLFHLKTACGDNCELDFTFQLDHNAICKEVYGYKEDWIAQSYIFHTQIIIHALKNKKLKTKIFSLLKSNRHLKSIHQQLPSKKQELDANEFMYDLTVSIIDDILQDGNVINLFYGEIRKCGRFGKERNWNFRDRWLFKIDEEEKENIHINLKNLLVEIVKKNEKIKIIDKAFIASDIIKKNVGFNC
ncbi:hypothetical protein HNQ56_003798 [Anaerotaenia torta]|uniref:hypothetical protein n=1 Tax=Anaerotaenia torta TaxID=433293 RepID=UPI003D1D0D4E